MHHYMSIIEYLYPGYYVNDYYIIYLIKSEKLTLFIICHELPPLLN